MITVENERASGKAWEIERPDIVKHACEKARLLVDSAFQSPSPIAPYGILLEQADRTYLTAIIGFFPMKRTTKAEELTLVPVGVNRTPIQLSYSSFA